MQGEGIIGLSRALVYAGSRNILVSLWSVSDQSTSDLMVDFYDYFLSDKDDFSTSLRKAKLKMISKESYSNPYYWAPVILIGK